MAPIHDAYLDSGTDIRLTVGRFIIACSVIAVNFPGNFSFLFYMAAIAEISEGKGNLPCLADMRFFSIVLCSMSHCLYNRQGAVFAGGLSSLTSRSYALASCSFALWYSSVWWTLSIILFWTVNNLRHNRGVTVYTVERLCNILDCTPNDILEFIADE